MGTRFETREVLAGAYMRAASPSLLTHVVEVDAAERDVRVLCRRVKLESMADAYANPDGLEAPATCPTCARRDPRQEGR